MRFKDKVVLITGAGNGIGAAAAKKFAEEGAKLSLVDIDQDGLNEVVKELELGNDDHITVRADISKEEDVKNYVEKTVDKFGKIDVFFNNAGIFGKVSKLDEYPVEVFDQVISVNLRGSFLGLKYVLKIMKEQKSGSIVNTSSIGGLKGMPNSSPYNATKYGIVGLTHAAAVEYAEYNIRVNSVNPSPAQTNMIDEIESMSNEENPDQAQADSEATIPMQRYATAQEVANAVLFLASDDASFITGVNLPVDGGMSAS